MSRLDEDLAKVAASALQDDEHVECAVRVTLPRKKFTVWSAFGGAGAVAVRAVRSAFARRKYRRYPLGFKLRPTMIVGFTGERVLVASIDPMFGDELLGSIPADELDEVHFSMRSGTLSISVVT